MAKQPYTTVDGYNGDVDVELVFSKLTLPESLDPSVEKHMLLMRVTDGVLQRVIAEPKIVLTDASNPDGQCVEFVFDDTERKHFTDYIRKTINLDAPLKRFNPGADVLQEPAVMLYRQESSDDVTAMVNALLHQRMMMAIAEQYDFKANVVPWRNFDGADLILQHVDPDFGEHAFRLSVDVTSEQRWIDEEVIDAILGFPPKEK